MKTINTISRLALDLSIFLMCGITYAQTTYVVDNNENAGAQFTNVQDAIDAASDGDIILV